MTAQTHQVSVHLVIIAVQGLRA
jgi:hypothetical protein